MDKYKSVKEWFAAELKEKMIEYNLRSYHLTALCKMSEDEVQKCLKGIALPGLFSLVLLADKFECTVNDLLGYDEVEDLDVYEHYSASSMFFAKSQYALCLSERVRRYLEDHYISIPDLADKIDVAPATVRHWFAKAHPTLPTTEKILNICEALNCTPSDLLGY